MGKRKVLLTGASGSMGSAAFNELLERRERFDIVLILLPNLREKWRFQRYEKVAGVRIVWGDLTRYPDVLSAVKGVDYVINAAALIPPEADRNPERATQVNVGSVVNILNAIKADPGGAGRIKLVNIASIAMTGDRRGTRALGRVGDPLKPSLFDNYAVSKMRAERLVIESGLKYWVSLRQCYIAVSDVLSLMDPIMFHQPLDTCLEFSTQRDAGRMVVNACEANIPEAFWGRVYNAGGGPSCRCSYEEYLTVMMKIIGLGDYRNILERRWFCSRNFHSHYYADSDELNGYLDFQRESFADHCQQVRDNLPWVVLPLKVPGLGRLMPRALIKHFVMKRLATSEDAPLGWIERNEEEKIAAFYGSREEFEAISDWNETQSCPPGEMIALEHGYDESKPSETLDIGDMQGAARFRGGRCLSKAMRPGDMQTKLRWECAFAHVFEGSPYLVLKTGHWCPTCAQTPREYERIARRNPFLAQICPEIAPAL